MTNLPPATNVDDQAGAPSVPAAPAPLRVGLLVDGFSQPAWVMSILREICAAGIADIALVVVNQGVAEPVVPADGRAPLARRLASWWRNRSALPYVAYSRFDSRRYFQAGDPESPEDASAFLAGRPVLRVTPRMTKFCDYFPDDALAEIRARDLDVLLRFGFRILKGDVLRAARFGVWSFHHGDNGSNRGGPPGFWEVMEQEPVTGAVLQVLSEELDAGLVLARSFSSTNPISVAANKRNYYWQAAPLLVATLRRLYLRRGALLDEARAATEWTAYSRPLFVAPRAGEMVRLAARLAVRLLSGKLRTLGAREQWFLAYRATKRTSDASHAPDGSPHRFTELVPPKDRFWADPFPVVADGARYIFFEEHVFGTPHAHICVVAIDDRGAAGAPRRVLERPYHLSYPFVFAWNGDWYMIPETLERNAVELFRASRFPDAWEFDRTLMTGIPAVDATIAEIDGRWWMFVGLNAPATQEATLLHIYHAASPLGPWVPHELNPVKIDVRNARPAGPLFRHEGHWYRPAQCGAPAYGSATVINRIVELTPSTFREVEVSRLTPTWRGGLTGTHTIAAAGGLTAIDARQRRRRF